jgi:hypothetical protein
MLLLGRIDKAKAEACVVDVGVTSFKRCKQGGLFARRIDCHRELLKREYRNDQINQLSDGHDSEMLLARASQCL